MTPNDTTVDGLKQAFEDFMEHEAERVIAEATRDQAEHKRLWVTLYGDGRYDTAHAADPESIERHDPDAQIPHITFPIEPLRDNELDPSHIENSRFEGPLERIWTTYERTMHDRFDPR